MYDQQKLEKIFQPKELNEINLLAAQDNPQLASIAFDRLKSYSDLYVQQLNRNQKYEELSEEKMRKIAITNLPGLAIFATGSFTGNRFLESGGLLYMGFNVLRNARWIVAKSVGFPGPYPDADSRVKYIDSIMQQHPGKPTEA